MTAAAAAAPSSRPPAVRVMRNLGLEPDPWQIDVLEECSHARVFLAPGGGRRGAVAKALTRAGERRLPIGDRRARHQLHRDAANALRRRIAADGVLLLRPRRCRRGSR